MTEPHELNPAPATASASSPGVSVTAEVPPALAASAEAASAPASPPAKSPLLSRLPPLRGRGGIWLAAIAAGAVLAWQGFALHQRVGQLEDRLDDSATQAREAVTAAESAQEVLQVQATRLTVMEAKLADLSAQEAALEGRYQELSRSRDEWLLAEVDQLVGLAAQQLQLAGNAQAAIAALTSADARLARSERAQFVNLRKAVVRDLQKLRNMPLVDSAGLVLRIEGVVASVDKMTLAFEGRPQIPASPKARTAEKVREPASVDWTAGLSRLGLEVWNELRTLIRIERLDRPDPVLLAPQNTVFLRENLKLRLMGARLALLGRDQATFRVELRQALAWIERYFDLRERSVIAAQEALKPLASAEFSIEPPTLVDSQSALRMVKLSADRVVR